MFVEYRKGYDIFRHKDGNGRTYYAVTEHMRKGVLLTFRTLEEARNFIDDLTAWNWANYKIFGKAEKAKNCEKDVISREKKV